MANTIIQLKRSSVPGNTPANNSIQPGELAINLADRKLFSKDTANVVFDISLSGPQGPQGSAGSTGPQGAQGTTGPQGNAGTTGPQGAQGAQGAQGTEGVDGDRYQTTSNTSYTIQAPGNSGTIVVETGLSYSAGQSIKIAYDVNNIQSADVTTYYSANGQLNFNTTANTGSGTYSSWVVNLAGATGAIGPQGSQGAQGNAGSLGPTGPQGNQGSTGPQGDTGPQGATGAQGPQGTAGSTGAQGSQGAQGATGTTGSQGSQGAQGSQGPQGRQGSTGLQGAQGDIGAQGAQGAQGSTGSQGSQGAQGAQGTTGTTGSQGPQGTTGSVGPTGPQGNQGAQGAQGNQGSTGNTGAQGNQGAQGPQGNQGSAGTTGAQGNQGAQGAQGPQGRQGAQGNDGGMLTPGSYVVRAVKNGSGQTVNNDTDTVVTLIDDFDPQGWFTSNQFKPTVAGYYSITAQVWWDAGSVTNNQTNIQFRKNGSTQVAIDQTQIVTGSGYGQSLDTIAYFNGTTDYVELTAYTGNPTSQNINGAAGGTFFTAALYAYGQQGATGAQGAQGTAGPQGAQGTTGSQGAQGAQGTTGSQGPQGIQGSTGQQGSTGPQGAQGTTGSIGPTGPQGSQGAQGNIGAQGPQGLQGTTGTTGAQGPQGTQGAQGNQGAQGAQGAQGPQGTQGTAGARGGTLYAFSTTTTDSDPGTGTYRFDSAVASSITFMYIDNLDSSGVSQTTWYDTWDDSTSSIKGQLVIQSRDTSSLTSLVLNITGNVTVATGYYKIPVSRVSGGLFINGQPCVVSFQRTGDIGSTGSQGAQGAQGSQGTTGAQGNDGPQGPQGAQGTAGTNGSTGAQGAQGAQGTTGSIGPTGPQGPQGTTGTTGSQGAQGAQGTTGSQGPQGAQGSQGTAGSNGSQGAQGAQGTVGVTGSQGPQGAQGAQGTIGTTGPQGSQGAQGTAGTAGSLANWTRITSNTTLVSTDRVIADTSGGTFTVTLPSSPSIGQWVIIADGADFFTTNLTVARNGSTIESIDEDMLIDIKDVTVELVYDGSTWEVYASVGQKGDDGVNGAQGATGAQGAQGAQGTSGSLGPTGPQGAQGAGATIPIGDDIANNATRYLTFITGTSGNVSSIFVSSSKLFYNPSTGTLSATNFNSLSDLNYKSNVVDLNNSSELLSKIRPVQFTWKDSGKLSYGVIAQELIKDFPELVEENSNGDLTVSYIPIIAMLVDNAKHLQKQIDELKKCQH